MQVVFPLSICKAPQNYAQIQQHAQRAFLSNARICSALLRIEGRVDPLELAQDETLPLTNGAEDDSESQWTGISIGENADERDEEPGNGQNCNASEAAKDQSKDGPTKNAASKQISERMTEMFSNDPQS